MHSLKHTESQIDIVTRADDAGLAKGVNNAVRDCFEDGILRNVSVMPTGPALDHAAERLANVEGLCTGVHVMVTAEWDQPNIQPVLPPEDIPSLVDESGTLPTDVTEFEERSPDPEEVTAEVKAQIERLREAGFEPSYLDSHHAIGAYVDWFGELLSELSQQEGLADATHCPDRQLDGSELPPVEGELGPQWLIDSLDAAEPGRYAVVGHPLADDDESGAAIACDSDERSRHRQMFTNPRVRQYVARHGIDVLSCDEAADRCDGAVIYHSRAPAGSPARGK